MKTNYKVAIVGSTGLVGRTVLKVLEEKNFKNCTYTLFASTGVIPFEINSVAVSGTVINFIFIDGINSSFCLQF